MLIILRLKLHQCWEPNSSQYAQRANTLSTRPFHITRSCCLKTLLWNVYGVVFEWLFVLIGRFSCTMEQESRVALSSITLEFSVQRCTCLKSMSVGSNHRLSALFSLVMGFNTMVNV